jgi:hypothetical protein
MSECIEKPDLAGYDVFYEFHPDNGSHPHVCVTKLLDGAVWDARQTEEAARERVEYTKRLLEAV